jgi:hypothetical protein
MRRLLCALVALCLALPAQAGRLLVIKQNTPATSEGLSVISKELAIRKAVLDALGVDYDVVPQSVVAARINGPATNLNQAAIRTGLVSFNDVGTVQRQYAGVVHMGFTVAGAGGNTRVTGYNPDTLTLARSSGGVSVTWPSVPQLFLGIGNVPSAGIYTSVAACSTGVTSGGLSSFQDNAQRLSLHMVGQPEVWNENGGHIYYREDLTRGLTILAGTPGITKARVVIRSNSSAFRENGRTSCTDCDSIGRPATYFESPAADTALIWTRQRDINDLSGMQIFMLPSYANNGPSETDVFTFAMSIAIMDSATGGQIIGQKPGWEPLKVGFVVSGAFTRSKSDASSSSCWSCHGTQPSDTALVKAGIDSLAALKIPVVVTVNVDSIATYPYEKSWWTRLKLARFSPESRVYIDSLNANQGQTNASRYNAPDVFGAYRSRQLITPTRFDYCTACGNGDTTLSCQLAFMRGRLDSVPEFRGRMSSTIFAPFFDYVPRNFQRSNMPQADSFAVALLRSGYDTAINGTMFMGSTPSASWGTQSGSPFSAGPSTNAPNTWYPNPRLQTVKGVNGQTIGQLRWLNMRHIDEDPGGLHYAFHATSNEFATGMFMSPWYISDTPYWNHVMRSRLSVYLIKPGDLGWLKNATSNPTRTGYLDIKWLVNQIRAVNKFANRTVIAITYPEDINPQ